ncbi:sulfotransferase family protein [Mesorhizobium loti]|uniref:sulfotransferase family protein n=1 Tax=Rhizobium loti TaxID=381 RepID=UPI00047E5BF5|nr:sulfotransferase family protein [Mesorhizobium loti]
MGSIVDMSTLSGARVQPGMDAVRVMGTPRSGTNLAKYLLERYLGVPVVFDHGFWKHGIFPALMNGRDIDHGGMPIVVLSKDPVSQILSWFRLARNDTIFKPNGNLGSFLKQPFDVRQDFTAPKRMEYRFHSPADYWNQFYFAMDALHRSGAPVHFVRYEALVSEPALSLHMLSHFLGRVRPFDVRCQVEVPRQTLDASNDIDQAAGLSDEKIFDPARAELASALARIGWRNANTILRAVDDDVLDATGRAGFRQTCREAVGAKALLRSLVGFW